MERDQAYLDHILLLLDEQETPFITAASGHAPTDEAQKRNHHIRLLCDDGLLMRDTDDTYRLTAKGHTHIRGLREAPLRYTSGLKRLS